MSQKIKIFRGKALTALITEKELAMQLEACLRRSDPQLMSRVARSIVQSHFPEIYGEAIMQRHAPNRLRLKRVAWRYSPRLTLRVPPQLRCVAIVWAIGVSVCSASGQHFAPRVAEYRYQASLTPAPWVPAVLDSK